MAYRDLPILTKLYVIIIIALGIAASVFTVTGTDIYRPLDFSLLLYVVITMVAARASVLIPYVRVTFSVDTAFVFTILILYGPIPAIFADAAARLVITIANFKENFFKLPFNAFSAILATFAAYLAFDFLHFADMSSPSFQALPIIGMITAYFLADTFIVAMVICVTERKNLFKFWYKNFFPTSMGYLVSGSVGTLLVILDKSGGILSFIVVVPVLLLFYFLQRIYLQKEEDNKAHISELENINIKLLSEIEERKKTQDALTHRVQLEEKINLISKKFINLPVHEVDDGIIFALKTIGNFFGYSRCFVFSIDSGTKTANWTHEWCDEGITPLFKDDESADLKPYMWAFDMLKEFRILNIPTLDSIPGDGKNERELLQTLDMKSLLIVPMIFGGELMGAIVFGSAEEKMYQQKDEVFLVTFAEILTNAISHRTIMNERKKLETQLVQSQKMEAIGRLAGGVAHDFNNMLTGIIGHIDLAYMEGGDQAKDYLDKAGTAAARARAVVGQLLAFSRKSTAEPVVMDPAEVVEEVMGMLSETIDKRIRIKTRSEKGRLAIFADPAQYSQILMNLCLNARDAIVEILSGEHSTNFAARKKPFHIDIDLESAEVDSKVLHTDQGDWDARPGKYVLLSVTDNGCGMDNKTLEHIFEPFYTTKSQDKGTGLGLATVFGLVKQLGGWINVYSDMGQGSTFRVFIPEYVGEKPAPAKDADKEEIAGGNETILLVDDELVIRQLGQTILERFGYDVILAEDGREGLEIYRRKMNDISLVILDMSMPNMSGTDALKELKQINPSVKVLMNSGHAALDDTLNEEVDQFAGFIAKPYTVYDFAKIVRSILDQK